MEKYGYVRISSKDQNPDRQMDALLQSGIDQTNIYIDKVSGKNFNRPAYQRLVCKVQKGDCILIKSIDRLGRNYAEILEQWRILTKDKGVDVEVLDMPLLNTTTERNGLTGVFISDLVLQILAYVAETERSFIRQRQEEGIASAKSRGIVFGRKRLDIPETFEAAYENWMSGKLSSRKAAKAANMSHTTFYRRCMEMTKKQ